MNIEYKKVIDNSNLVSKPTCDYLINNFTVEELENVFVFEIDKQYMGGLELCDHYGINPKIGVNCLICECKRNDDVKYAALLVPTGYRYNMSSVVRKHTNSRMVSVAPLDYVLNDTKMEYGSINPIGLPNSWKIYIDPIVLENDMIVCGSGIQNSKLYLPSKYLLKLNNIEVLEDLAKGDKNE